MEAVFPSQGQDISRWDVLRAAAQEVGLDADAMQRETKSSSFTAGFHGLKYADKMIGKQKPLQWLNHRKAFLFAVHGSLNTGSIRTATP